MYRYLRDLHLYLGLFISPFVVLFAASVFFLNHAKVGPSAAAPEMYRDLRIPDDLERLKGRLAVDRARDLMPQVGATGEIGFLRYTRDRHLIFPVSRPWQEAVVDVDLAARTAAVTRRRTGVWESFAYLHKTPGPHLVALRGNWFVTQIWRVFADATIYLLLFISVSGVYLWWAIKAERRIGLALLGAGAATFFGLLYVIVR